MTTYNIIRKHSSDNSPKIQETVSTKEEARKYIKAEVKDLGQTSTPHTVATMGDVTNINFVGIGTKWSIGYWFEKVA
jgi:hypothetical protein